MTLVYTHYTIERVTLGWLCKNFESTQEKNEIRTVVERILGILYRDVG